MVNDRIIIKLWNTTKISLPPHYISVQYKSNYFLENKMLYKMQRCKSPKASFYDKQRKKQHGNYLLLDFILRNCYINIDVIQY